MNKRWMYIPILVMFTAFVVSVTAVSSFAESNAGAYADQRQANSLDMSNSFNSGDPIRQLPLSVSPPVEMRGGPAYFSGPGMDMGPQFIPASQLVAVLNAVDTAQEFIGDDEDEDIDAYVTIFNKEVEPKCKCVKFEIINKETRYELRAPLAIGSVTTGEESVTSASLAAKLCKIAHSVGASKVVIMREGIVAQLESTGWGIGLSNSVNVSNSSPTGIGGMAVSGTGYSSGQAHYIKLPYMTVTFVK